MSFQPPPPPPGSVPPPPPPPPPPGQWGPPPGGGSSGFNAANVNPLDWGILGVGVIAFLFSFIDFYSGGTVSYLGHSVDVSGGSASAWHEIFGGGFFAWFAMVFAIAAAVVTALQLFMPQVKLPMPNRLVALILMAAAALFEIIAIFVTPGDSYAGASYSVGHGFGFWLSLIVMLGGTVLALMRAQQTNTALPGPLASLPNIGQKGPGGQGGPPQPPPPGYGPPQPPPPPGYGPPQ